MCGDLFLSFFLRIFHFTISAFCILTISRLGIYSHVNVQQYDSLGYYNSAGETRVEALVGSPAETLNECGEHLSIIFPNVVVCSEIDLLFVGS